MADFIILDTEEGVVGKSRKKSLLRKVDDWLQSQQKITLQQKVVFYRWLATMVNAGLSIIKALSILERQEKSKYFKTMLI